MNGLDLLIAIPLFVLLLWGAIAGYDRLPSGSVFVFRRQRSTVLPFSRERKAL